MASESTLRLAAVLASLALLALASAPAAAGSKKYFLTPNAYPTNEAGAACGKGFHMASLFEILDPTQLSYDTKRGHVSTDSGSGPPAGVVGWIRTGGSPSVATTPGLANCNGLSSTMTLEYGTTVQLDDDWSAAGLGISPWVAQAASCAGSKPVWCKQN